MNEISLTYFPYILKFKSPFLSSKFNITERRGFIIELVDSLGNKGIGESAPFPEFGSETYEASEKRLSTVSLNLNLQIDNLAESLNTILKNFSHFPCTHHGLEQAILTLLSKSRKSSINNLLNIKSNNKVSVNGVVGILPPQKTLESAEALIANGFKTLKLKIGREDFLEDLNCIKLLRENLSNDIKLRLDVNGKWNLDEAIENISKIDKFRNIEYIEQPVNKLNDFTNLHNKVQTPLAVDESIRTLEDAKLFLESKSVEYLILKPMMLGGLLPALQIIKLAESLSIKCVVTSSFESAIGRSFAVLAASFVKHNIAHGLDTGKYFEKDLINDPFPIVDGEIKLSNS